jgi:hypothetical protein
MSFLFLNSWRVIAVPYYVTILTLQLFKNSIDTQGKLRLNLHSLSVSELLEYGRNANLSPKFDQNVLNLSLGNVHLFYKFPC